MPVAAEAFSGACGLWNWAEPLVNDVLRETYEAEILDAEQAREVAVAHARLWRALANGESDTSVVDRLEGALARIEYGIALFNDANAAVAAELAETVRCRYRLSLRSRETYERVLAAIGHGLAVGAR